MIAMHLRDINVFRVLNTGQVWCRFVHARLAGRGENCT